MGLELGRELGEVLGCLWSEDEMEKERGNGRGEREDGGVGVLEEDVKSRSGIRIGYSDLKNGVEGGLVVVATEGTSYWSLSKQAEAEASNLASSNLSNQSAQATEAPVHHQEM